MEQLSWLSAYLKNIGLLSASLLLCSLIALTLITFIVLMNGSASQRSYQHGADETERFPPLARLIVMVIAGSGIWTWLHRAQIESSPPDRFIAAPPPSHAAPLQDEERKPKVTQALPSIDLPKVTPFAFTLERNSDQRFYATISAGEIRTHGIIDTSTSTLTLPAWMASALHVPLLRPSTSAMMADGTVPWEGTIPQLEVEGHVLRNVPALFPTNYTGIPLLGQSVLARFELEQHGDRLYFKAVDN